jgi:hypothetical protein
VCQQKCSTTTRAVRYGIDMTLVLYEMWDSTAWDWRPSSTTVLQGARSTQASVTGKLYSLKDDLSRYWLLVGDQRTGRRCQYVGRHDLLDYNMVKGNEAILDGYWILSLTPSWFLGHWTKSFQVKKLNSVNHPLKFFIMNLCNNVTKECTEVYSN